MKYCSTCGNALPEGSKFCAHCGTPVTSEPQNEQSVQVTPDTSQASDADTASASNSQEQTISYNQNSPYEQNPQYGQNPYGQNSYGQAPYGQMYQKPMKWFKFLIYFALWFSCVINILGGIRIMTGGQYEGAATLVYAFFGSLKILDIVYGLASIALGIFAIYTRFQLAHFRSAAPKLVNILYICSAAASILYGFIASSIISDFSGVFSFIFSGILSAVMVVLNTIYFKKRANLFVN